MKLRLDLDGETFDRLMEVAAQERRPLDWQAEVLLRQALGLPFPYPDVEELVQKAPDK
jgi:hypothetical protein